MKEAFGIDMKKFDNESNDEFELPEDFKPILSDVPLYTEHAADALSLFWAPHPFDKRSGRTRRAVDIPL